MVTTKRSHSTALPKGLDRLPSGNIRVRVVNDAGVQVTVGTYADRRSADLALARAKADISRGDWLDPAVGKVTFAEMAEQVRIFREGDLRERTRQENAYLLKVLLPVFGNKPIGKISVRMVDQWWPANAEHPVARRNRWFLMSSIFRYAIRWGYVKQSPCQVENAGADASKPRPVHTVAEFETVVMHLPPGLARAARVMFGLHLRVSEVCGLNWNDVNAKTGTVSVVRQADRTHTAKTMELKTGREGRKTITPLRMAAEALQEQRQQSPGIGAQPIFLGPAGGRLRAAYLGKHWRIACTAAGIENFHLHDLRHVSLTLMGKESLATLMRRGGHATARAALRYQAAWDEADAAAVAAVDERLLQELG